jgi:PadR family transcriptional regulator PadR
VRQSEFLRGGLELAVMALLARGESYGYELLTGIRDAGFDEVGDASMYGTLKRLETAGLLSSRLIASASGPARRYYKLSPRGKNAHAAAVRNWRAFRDSLDTIIGPGGTS